MDPAKIKSLLFEPFETELFLTWFYENEAYIQINKKKFHHEVFKDWGELILPNQYRIKELIKIHFLKENQYKYWEIEFFIKKIMVYDNAEKYGILLYSEYYEDKENFFLNSLCDLIVLYCYNKENLGLPPLNNTARSRVNQIILYPKIILECEKVIKIVNNISTNKESILANIGTKNSGVDFSLLLQWYKEQIKNMSKE